MKNPMTTHTHPQRLAVAGVLLFAAMAVGCTKTTPEVELGALEAAGTSGTETSPLTARGGVSRMNLPDAIKKDMAYADLRRRLLDSGWESVKDPQCQVQVAGYDEKTCSDSPDLALCKACEQMPELSAYSGDGFATSRFRDARTGETLKVVSYGMIEDWNVPGEDSRLRVEEWEGAGTSTHE